MPRRRTVGVVAEPVPARDGPAGVVRAPARASTVHELSATNNGLTVKRCVPFLDALTSGWILPLAATVRLEISDDGRDRARRAGSSTARW